MPHRKVLPGVVSDPQSSFVTSRNHLTLWRHKYIFRDVTVNGTRAVKYYLVLFLHRMFAQWLVAKTIEFVDRRVCLQKVQICTCPHFEKFKFTHAHISKSLCTSRTWCKCVAIRKFTLGSVSRVWKSKQTFGVTMTWKIWD